MSASKRFQDAHLAQDGSADLSGLVRLPPTNAHFHFNGVIYNVKYGVNYVKSCVSLSMSQVSVHVYCPVIVIIVQVCSRGGKSFVSSP